MSDTQPGRYDDHQRDADEGSLYGAGSSYYGDPDVTTRSKSRFPAPVGYGLVLASLAVTAYAFFGIGTGLMQRGMAGVLAIMVAAFLAIGGMNANKSAGVRGLGMVAFFATMAYMAAPIFLR